MVGDYQLCGWRVRSDLSLPELLPWTGSAEKRPDVTITAGPVAEELAKPGVTGKWRSVGADGSVLLNIHKITRILVQNGTSITVDVLQRDSTASWRLFLLGSALGFLCHQRGLFPLHAATVKIGNRTVALAGHSQVGKSTLAFELTRRGHGLLSDDVTVLRTEPRIEVLPAFPRLKLWRTTLTALGVETTGLPQVREAMEKYDLRPREGFDPAFVPLDAIVSLREGPEPILLVRSQAEAMPLVNGYVFRKQAALHLGRRAALFAQAALIANTVPVYSLERPKNFDMLPAAATLIERLFGS